MTINGFTSRNYAAQVNNTTVVTRAYDRTNAVKFLQSKDSSLADKDVYNHDGSGPDPIDEVYCKTERELNDKGELVWKDNYKVRMKDEYAHLAQA
jgi:hypothetical protein